MNKRTNERTKRIEWDCISSDYYTQQNHGVNKIVLCSKIINNNSVNTSEFRHNERKREREHITHARFILYDKDHVQFELDVPCHQHTSGTQKSVWMWLIFISVPSLPPIIPRRCDSKDSHAKRFVQTNLIRIKTR